MYKKLILILGLGSFLSLGMSTTLNPIPPSSFAILSENKKYIYVHIEEKDNQDEIYIENHEDLLTPKILRQKFSKEGLYAIRNEKFLWVIEDKVDVNKSVFHPMNDGTHLMLETGQLVTKFTDNVFSFYKNGKLIKKYKVADFCTDSSFFPVSRFDPSLLLWYFNEKLDIQNSTYSFTSCDKNFSIEIQSGEISVKDSWLVKIKNKYLRWTGQNFKKNVLH